MASNVYERHGLPPSRSLLNSPLPPPAGAARRGAGTVRWYTVRFGGGDSETLPGATVFGHEMMGLHSTVAAIARHSRLGAGEPSATGGEVGDGEGLDH